MRGGGGEKEREREVRNAGWEVREIESEGDSEG